MKNSHLKRLLQVALYAVLLVAVSASASENLIVHFIDVGQSDSELLQFAGKNVLIDAGDILNISLERDVVWTEQTKERVSRLMDKLKKKSQGNAAIIWGPVVK